MHDHSIVAGADLGFHKEGAKRSRVISQEKWQLQLVNNTIVQPTVCKAHSACSHAPSVYCSIGYSLAEKFSKFSFSAVEFGNKINNDIT